MRYTMFGNTGFRVSSLGFGAMNLPGVPLEQARETLNYALDHGINYIDTAAGYRNSEEIIGECISHRRTEYFLATKTARRDYAGAMEEIERSLTRMKTDVIDLLQIHYVNTVQDFKAAMGENGAYQAALEMKRMGHVRFIGLTGHRPDLLTKWIAKDQFDQVLFHLSLVQPFALDELIPELIRRNMGRTAMKPLSGGFVQPVSKAIRYPYSQDVHTTISGMVSIAEVKENMAAMEAEIGEREKIELEALAKELGSHNCRRCNYCSCPVEVKIPDVMISSQVRRTFGLLPKGNEFYEKQQGPILSCAEHEPCKEKPLCEQQCPYHLPIQQMVTEASLLYNKVSPA
ncbi:aldo/keto reductase [Paenibacillus mucilaginosus 3016]|uniref:Aldo/keto reductase n=2 Tax=Paenibacillus mucilaginosus TaxID=61624 RepID=H6NTN7_9BACL|nr:aldo/keto reductase [Paenibacillus mucilaginosus]AFC27631.1 aldo/keto reductase [Paenibacillus mucilaginosus 3016]AFH59787.1 aldo/keto reductase [Paenibacillus mucilaginosus K02]WFA16519.1 aldo/keto reductase [Paenibacillus mucilaginosus]